jgi:secondary thiamine-phosphate synthase enzyme
MAAAVHYILSRRRLSGFAGTFWRAAALYRKHRTPAGAQRSGAPAGPKPVSSRLARGPEWAVIRQFTIEVSTRGRGTSDITGELDTAARDSGIRTGLLHAFIQHTSASLVISENADPAVHRDLERFLGRVAPDGDPMFEHDAEGPDDMPAHVRTMLTSSAVSIPVAGGRLALGTWQGIYVYEHRTSPHRRRVVVTVHGE